MPPYVSFSEAREKISDLVGREDIDELRTFLKDQVDPARKIGMGDSFMWNGINQIRPKVLEFAFELGANPNPRIYGEDGLMVYGDGTYVPRHSPFWTSIHNSYTAERNRSQSLDRYLKIASILLEHGANVNGNPTEFATPLMMLTSLHAANTPRTIKFLLDHTDPRVPDQYGRSPADNPHPDLRRNIRQMILDRVNELNSPSRRAVSELAVTKGLTGQSVSKNILEFAGVTTRRLPPPAAGPAGGPANQQGGRRKKTRRTRGGKSKKNKSKK